MKVKQSRVHAFLLLPEKSYQNESFHPLHLKIYGLTLLERTLCALERVPVCKVTLLTGDDLARQAEEYIQKMSLGIEVEVSQKPTLENVVRSLPANERILVISEPVVLDPAAVRQLIEQDVVPAIAENGFLLYTNAGTLKPENPLTVKLSSFCHPVRNPVELKEVKKNLRRSLVKSSDGWVSRHLNRPVSISISRVLARTAITPNQFTIITGLLGILTGWLLAQGGYWGFMLGALMFHFTSILDGVDGELARLKFKASPFGQWLDTLVDNSSYILALGGFLVGIFRDGVSDFEKIAGASTLLFTILALSSMYYYLRRFGKGGSLLNIDYGFQEGKTGFDRFMLVMAAFGKRDLFALIFFGLGLIGQLPLALVYISILTAALFGFSIYAHIRALRK